MLVKRLLEFQPFHDRFSDPVDVRELLKVVFDVADRNALEVVAMRKSGLVFIEKSLDGPFGMGVAFIARSRNIEQQDIHAGVRELAGNAQPHSACTDNSGFVNLVHWCPSD